jgi:Cu+-exporting ATPase
MEKIKETVTAPACYHCGEICASDYIQIDEKIFCCNGCKLVYELLEEKDLCAYYTLARTPGSTPPESGITSKYQYLDDESIQRQLLNFSDGTISKITLRIPSIHCSSCIWLLENLYRVDPGVLESRINFLRKELSLSYSEEKTSLRKIIEMLSSIGYEPEINLASVEQKLQRSTDKELYLQIGIAGFAFGNIMLLSFPDYLAINKAIEPELLSFFSYLSILLALPVLFYSSIGYFRSAFQSLKQKTINMDVPISLGIITLFGRSLYHILALQGPGYLDSFAGLVFLLLIGKLFQKKTYDTLSFDRDFRSYFPLSVTTKQNNKEISIPIEKLTIGDRIILLNNELVPADAVLLKSKTWIDYSFVTGEATPVEKVAGDVIYAGGMHLGSQSELEIIKEVSQSYLTQLWNDDAFNKQTGLSKMTTLANTVSRYFTFIVLAIASLSAMYWLPDNITLALNAFTAVLIVACPCALALSTPFTLGNTLRIFGKNKFYLKNVSVIESMAKIGVIVFDKTGTLTFTAGAKGQFYPAPESSEELNDSELIWIRSLVRHSKHPLSKRLYSSLNSERLAQVVNFQEHPGKGISARIEGQEIMMGSERITGIQQKFPDVNLSSNVLVFLNGKYRGYFSLPHNYRKGIKEMVLALGKRFNIFLVSGDNEAEKNNLQPLFNNHNHLLFNQTPFDKLRFIKNLQQQKTKVMMIGDGLNDAGALKQSDVGISIAEDINVFTPASDGILDSENFARLTDFLKFSKTSIRIIIFSFLISFIYNVLGLFFAVQGTLSPLIAAILMPASSLTVVLFTIGATAFFGKKRGFKI